MSDRVHLRLSDLPAPTAGSLRLDPDGGVLSKAVREALGRTGPDLPQQVRQVAARLCAERCSTAEVPPERLHAVLHPITEVQALAAVGRAATAEGAVILDAGVRSTALPAAGRTIVPAAQPSGGAQAPLHYDHLRRLLAEHRPRLLIAGGDRCPVVPEWALLRELCDELEDCLLVAELGQTAGLVIGAAVPSPVGLADAVTFTTHGTLLGPPGAGLLTGDHDLARAVARALGPAEAGLHSGWMPAVAVAMAEAADEAFRALQAQIRPNARALCDALRAEGIEPAWGGTQTHLCLIEPAGADDEAAPPPAWLARVLEAIGLAGAQAGELLALGATWLTQRGAGEDEMRHLGSLLGATLRRTRRVVCSGLRPSEPQGRIALEDLMAVRAGARALIDRLNPFEGAERGAAPAELTAHPLFAVGELAALEVCGGRAAAFLEQAATIRLAGLVEGEGRHALLLDPAGTVIDDVLVVRAASERWLVYAHAARRERVAAWLEGLAAGVALCDAEDPYGSTRAAASVLELGAAGAGAGDAQARLRAGLPAWDEQTRVDAVALCGRGRGELLDLTKPWFVGQSVVEQAVQAPPALPRFDLTAEEPGQPLLTPLAGEHERLGARMIDFAGWRMPVWYSSVAEEHAAVREAAGLFDIAHMGLIEIAGPGATEFLEAVATNRAEECPVGGCQYTCLLGTDGLPIDDIIIFRRATDDFLAVVNAANAGRVWAWLQAVHAGSCRIDERFPHHRIGADITLRDLKALEAGDDRLVGMALQGPASAQVLHRLRQGPRAAAPFRALGRFEFTQDRFARIATLISRTGYTGEALGYELFVHPDAAPELWRAILEAGADLGVRPAGLGARDSTRIEAGLPLFGHELAGPHQITPAGAGYARFVRCDKPFFVGRDALLGRERERTSRVV
ncbi:MAG: hypothetical protein AB7Y46_19545, partial [Armatimonadota bacterium]